ncbi:hypothetical protein Gotur_001721 [Gossypium turneri]
MGPMTVEGRTCETKSSEYKGICLFDANCDSICKVEPGFDAEAKTCEAQSSKFKGMCMSSTNCASVCKSEPGFDGGHCRGFRRQCVCTKPC